MLLGETVHSALPQDIPWWSPDFAIFFTVLYLVLFFIFGGVGYVIVRAWWEEHLKSKDGSIPAEQPAH